MNLGNIYAFDKGAYEEGTWVTLGNGIKIKVRSPQSAHSRAVRKKLEAPHASLTRGGRELPDDVQEDLLIKQLSQSLIMDWKGVTEDDGTVIPATPENIERALRLYPFFRDDAGSVIGNRETFKTRVLEEDLGN